MTQRTSLQSSGRNREHLILFERFNNGFEMYAERESIKAFRALQKDAAKYGFNLQACSSWRSFERQSDIVLDKFTGKREILDVNEKALPQENFASPVEKLKAILLFSAMPGFSRHHFGTDFDVYDPDLIPKGGRLQLSYHEYSKGSYFFELGEYLSETLDTFGFARPYMPTTGGVPEGLCFLSEHTAAGREPWHISYLPAAEDFLMSFDTEEVLIFIENSDLLYAPYVREVMTKERISVTQGRNCRL